MIRIGTDAVGARCAGAFVSRRVARPSHLPRCMRYGRASSAIRVAGIFLVLFACSPIFTGSGAALAQSRAPAGPNEMILRMDGLAAPNQLGIKVFALLQQGLIPVHAETLANTRTPFAALITLHNWPREFGNADFERALCWANQHACCPYEARRRLVTLSASACRVLVSGSVRSKRRLDAAWQKCSDPASTCQFRWILQPPASASNFEATLPCANPSQTRRRTLCVPRLTITDFISAERVELKPTANIAQEVERRTNCRPRLRQEGEAREACLRLQRPAALNSLNAGSYKAYLEAFGTLNIPARAYTVSFPAPPEQQIEEAKAVVRPISPFGHQSLRAVGVAIGTTRELRRALGQHGNEAPPAASDAEKAKPIDYERASMATLEAMHWNPGLMKQLDLKRLPNLAVLETSTFLANHAELPQVRSISSKALLEARGTCPQATSDSYLNVSHGTVINAKTSHAASVLGVIAAARNNKATLGALAAAGAAPSASTLLVVRGQDFKNKNLVSDFSELCTPGFVTVANVSLSFDNGSAKDIARFSLVSDWAEGSILTVIAAGNTKDKDDKDKDAVNDEIPVPSRTSSAECNTYPACMSNKYRNLLSVVALDRTGQRIHPKSLRGTAYDVAAIGEIVGLSAQSGTATDSGTYGQTGTSFATPYVSSLGAFIYARYHQQAPRGILRPAALKQRILGTVDFVPELDQDVGFGRINFTRALQLDKDQVHLKAAVCNATPGTVPASSAGFKAARAIKLEVGAATDVDTLKGAPEQILMENVLRIARDCQSPDSDPRFNVIVAEPDGSSDWFRPVRYRQVRINAETIPIENKQGTFMKKSELGDFVACMRFKPKSRCLGDNMAT